MAAVDLLQDAYRNSLGREASAEELQGWTSGQFGGGNVNDWVNQIANSDEARRRQPQQQSQPEPTYHGYDTAPAPSGGQDDGLSQLGNAYTQYLGRSASPDELSNWWSGGYGYGQGASGLNAMLEAIRNSGEAKARNNGVAPAADRQSLEYWKGQGVGEGDIFDLMTGQLRPGWARITDPNSRVQGYQRTGGTTGSVNVQQQNGGDLQAWLRSQLSGVSSPQALAALETQLNQRGIRLQKDSFGNVRGRLYMPDGSTVDVVNQWGQPWTFIDRGKSTGGVSTPGDQYSDPYTRLLEQLFKSRLGGMDPNRQANIDALNNRAAQLQQGNSLLTQQMDYLQKRFQDLQGPGYTGAENEVIRTSALDPIESDRTQAKKMLANQLAAKGHRPGSGVYEAAMLELDNQFNKLRGGTQAQLTGNELARRENRNQRAEAISGTLASIPEERNRELLDVMNAIDKLSRLTATEEDAYARELSNLGPERLQLAMQASNAGGVTPSSLGSLLTQIAGLNQNGQAYNAQNSQALWSGLGQLAAIIGRQNQYGLGG